MEGWGGGRVEWEEGGEMGVGMEGGREGVMSGGTGRGGRRK